jgi:carbonic anhydrase
VRALYEPPAPATPHIARWLELAEDARLDRDADAGGALDEPLLRRTEQRSIALQLSRLLTYPMVIERVEQGSLSLHGWHYIIEEGRVEILDVERKEFLPAPAA